MDLAARARDANANRAAEALRVLEDLARFHLNAQSLGSRAKDLRHQLRTWSATTDVNARDTPADVGTTVSSPDEFTRSNLVDLVRANAARAAEALRSWEEFAKLPNSPTPAQALQDLRYAVYTLESALLAQLPAWRIRQTRLYALIDSTLCADPAATAAAVARGGAGLVQLRAKAMPLRAYRDLAQRVQDATRQAGALFVVNDHVAVAAAIGADGLHLGQDDLALADARKVVGGQMAIGVSAHSSAQALDAQHAHADYVGLGPMQATATKPHEPPRGPALLDAVHGKLVLPSFAIGGIDLPWLRQHRTRLPHGIALARVLCVAADPEAMAAQFFAELSQATAASPGAAPA